MPTTTAKKPKALAKTVKKTVSKTKTVKKAAVKKPLKAIKKVEKKIIKKEKVDYVYAVGRRKQSVARVRYYYKGDGEIIVNTKDYKQYFPYFEHQKIIEGPLKLVDKFGKGKITVKVVGGGIKGQADSIKLGISRILLSIDEELRPLLRANKFLTRDPRVKERKKYGLKKARRAPQWAKR